MSTPPASVVAVRGILHAVPGKKLLLVEGPSDKSVYEAWLKKLADPKLFTSKLVVEPVGGKPAVIRTLEWFRDYGGNPTQLFGLVDRDEWDSLTIGAQIAALPQLRIVRTRDCLESYFVDPDELEPSLRAVNAGNLSDIPAFRSFLEAALLERVPHWAVRTIAERIKEQMIAANYPFAFHNQIPIPADLDVRDRLQKWATLLDPNQLFNDFNVLRSQAFATPTSNQFRSHVYASSFFQDVVCPGPDGLQRFQAKPVDTWRLDLAEHAPAVPADIAAILQPLLV